MNRLNFLSEKSRSGTAGIGPDKGKVFKGGLTPEENAEYDRLFPIAEMLLKEGRPVYSVPNPDGTRSLSYTNPTAKEEAAYRVQYGANTSLAQAGMSPYGGGKVLNWAQKQEAMKRVEELRPKYASLPYAQQQEFDAIQRNLYASILVNKDNPNPPEANATSISDNAAELMQQYGFDKSLTGVQAGATPGSMPGASDSLTDLMGTVPSVFSAEAAEYNEYLKGRATQGLQTPSEAQWTKNYNTHRYETLKGKAFQGLKLTPQEQAESDFLINLGVAKPGYKTETSGTGNINIPAGTSPETVSLIKSLQKQITDLTTQASTATGKSVTTAETTRKNAIDVLTERFQRYGLGSLVNKIKELAVDGATEATITLGLQETEEYKKRFKANQARVAKGLSVLNPAEYLNVEDGYRQVLRAYGLKQFDTDDYVSQFIANDVSATELSNRVVTAVQRVQNADPAISRQLRDFYGIGQADLVAYVLDPNQQFQKIERQVAASEIGVAAARQGLSAGVSVAEQLAAQGVSQAEAQKGYATIADILPTSEKLSDIYGTTLEGYGQTEAEQEVFNSLASAQRKRQKLTQREIAAFSGSSGTNKTSLTTSAVGQF
jgi:hypothetical protein